MKIIKLDTIKQFEELKKGDCILVKWSKYNLKHNKDMKHIQTYNIYENKANQNEIICQLKHNHFFNYVRYLKGLSDAQKVYKVLEK